MTLKKYILLDCFSNKTIEKNRNTDNYIKKECVTIKSKYSYADIVKNTNIKEINTIENNIMTIIEEYKNNEINVNALNNSNIEIQKLEIFCQLFWNDDIYLINEMKNIFLYNKSDPSQLYYELKITSLAAYAAARRVEEILKFMSYLFLTKGIKKIPKLIIDMLEQRRKEEIYYSKKATELDNEYNDSLKIDN
jgi:hypothetical protein